MARPDVAGAGEDGGTRENPEVTSKFDRMHGQPRVPGTVHEPGSRAEPTFSQQRYAPTSVTHAPHGKIHHYAHDHVVMGGQHHGARPKHPYHDGKQESYEKLGYGGKRGR